VSLKSSLHCSEVEAAGWQVRRPLPSTLQADVAPANISILDPSEPAPPYLQDLVAPDSLSFDPLIGVRSHVNPCGYYHWVIPPESPHCTLAGLYFEWSDRLYQHGMRSALLEIGKQAEPKDTGPVG
jgi:hypothetical protein